MLAPAARTLEHTRAEYLALDEAAEEGRRWEYDGSRIYLMAGATPEHNQVAHNVSRHLGNALVPRGCHVTQSDQRVHLPPRYVYPDVVAHCVDGRYTDENPPSLQNPELVVEVISESTAAQDMNWKLPAYQEMSSIREIWLVRVEKVRVDQYVRTSTNEWALRYFESMDDGLRSEAFDLEIPVAELYELVL
jgi:Uma2 family endonuclease